MSGETPQPATGRKPGRPAAGTGFLYGWLLFALFIEYTRPLNVLPFLKVPFVLTIIPMLLFVCTMFAAGLRPAKDIFSDSRVKWIFVFILLIVATSAMKGFDKLSTDVVSRVVGYTIVFFLIARLVTTEKRLLGVVITLVVAHIYILATNFEVLANPSLRQYLVGAPFLGDGNDFALSIGLLFPCIIAVALLTRRKFGAILAWAAAAVIPLSLVASQSRGAMLGFSAVMAYMWWRSPNKKATAAGIVVLAGIVLLYAPPVYFERMGTVSTAAHEDSSAEGRLKAWSGSIGMAANRPLGLGAGHFGAYWGKTAHSTYFLALGELGVLGFVCVIVLIFGNMRANMRVRKIVLAQLPQPPPDDARRSLLLLDMLNAGLLYFAVTGAFLSATYYPHIYVLFGLLLAAREFVRRHAPQSDEAPARTAARARAGRGVTTGQNRATGVFA